jgi:hypothetical protein
MYIAPRRVARRKECHQVQQKRQEKPPPEILKEAAKNPIQSYNNITSTSNPILLLFHSPWA